MKEQAQYFSFEDAVSVLEDAGFARAKPALLYYSMDVPGGCGFCGGEEFQFTVFEHRIFPPSAADGVPHLRPLRHSCPPLDEAETPA
jgi:hypothetical protein